MSRRRSSSGHGHSPGCHETLLVSKYAQRWICSQASSRCIRSSVQIEGAELGTCPRASRTPPATLLAHRPTRCPVEERSAAHLRIHARLRTVKGVVVASLPLRPDIVKAPARARSPRGGPRLKSHEWRAPAISQASTHLSPVYQPSVSEMLDWCRSLRKQQVLGSRATTAV